MFKFGFGDRRVAGQKVITTAFSTQFTSAEQTITAAGALTIAHGLSAKPELVTLTLICKTAESNYSIGDELLQMLGSDMSGVNHGVSVVPDATDLNIRFGSDATTFQVLDKTTGAIANLTNANWKAIFKAWV